MKEIAIERIVIPPDRMRREGLADVESLKQSLVEVGLLNPITVSGQPDGTYILIAGERRLTAAKALGWTNIFAIDRDTATVDDRIVMEGVENLERKQYTWQEEIEVKRQIHEAMCRIHGRSTKEHRVNNGWTIENTAKMFGQHKATLFRELELCKAIEHTPEILEKPSKSAAMKYSRRSVDYKVRELLAKELALLDPEERWYLHHGKMEQLLPLVPSESVDCVCTDPPFGMNLDKEGPWDKNWSDEVYHDPQGKPYLDMIQTLLTESYRILKPGRHMYLFGVFHYYQRLIDLAKGIGFKPALAPIIWRLDAFTSKSMCYHTPNFYMILFLPKPYEEGSWQELDGYQSCIISDIPVVRVKRHPAEAPPALFERLILPSTRPHEVVLDAFCGSGSCGVAAVRNGRRFIGMDMEQKWLDLTLLRMQGVVVGAQGEGDVIRDKLNLYTTYGYNTNGQT